MRKFVVPIVALLGIALLSPHADAANLIIKSRAGKPGSPVSLPILVNNVGGTGQLWGVDFAMTFDTAKLAAATDAGTGASFTPQAVTGSTETPVVVSGAPSVGTVVTNPTLYVGYVRGTTGMPVTAGAVAPTNGIGLLRLSVVAGTATNQVVQLTVPAAYNVANDGTGSTTVSRNGATGATSDVAAGAAVNAEPITVLDFMPGAAAPAAGKPDLRVPMHEVAIGRPGDLNNSGGLDAGDLSNLSAVLNSKAVASWSEYKRVVADVGPLNGYTAANIGGTDGRGYGDGAIAAGDLSLLSAKLNNKASAANFPVAE